ncbi:MAG: ATP-binding protein [Pseudomonadota bacterium]
MKLQFVETANYAGLLATVKTMVETDPPSPRLGLVYGPPGRGKTFATDVLATRTGAAYLSAARVWTPSSMLRNIIAALGGQPAWSASDNLTRAAELLSERARLGTGSLLIVDEADYLMQGSRPPSTPALLDTIRDLHDLSHAPILLVGMESLARTLSQYPLFWDRCLIHHEFKGITPAEVQKLAKELAGLSLGQEAAELLVRATSGNLRQTILYLVRLERLALTNSNSQVQPGWIGTVEKEVAGRKLRLAGGLRRVK